VNDTRAPLPCSGDGGGPATRMRARLAQGGDVARAMLRELFPNSIWLEADSSGQYLWAQFDSDIVSWLYDSPADRAAADRADFEALANSMCSNESKVVAGDSLGTHIRRVGLG
jgi:hypothetical protein